MRSTILSATTSGLRECSRRGSTTRRLTLADFRFGFPLVPNKHNSALARVQYPIPVKKPLELLFNLIQLKAIVL